jgi:uncharacterized protein DUF4034
MHFYRAVLFTLFLCAISFAQTEQKTLADIAREYREQKRAQQAAQSAAQTRPVQNQADEQELFKQRIRFLILHQDYDGLEKMAAEARTSKARFAGGVWQLFVFYETFGESVVPNPTEVLWTNHLQALQQWMEARPQSITAPVAMAEALVAYAYHARGGGLADTVTEEGWRLMHERCEKALAVLNQAAQLPARDPYWYVAMLAVAQAEGFDKDRTRALFNEAVAFEPDFYHYYRVYTSYLLPKWYGKEGEAEAFVEEASRRVGGEQGAFLYFELSSVLNCQCGYNEDHMGNLSWPRIKEGYAVMEKLYGSSKLKRNRLAYMARLAEDKTVARQIFASIGDDWDNEVWKNRKLFDEAKTWAMN